MDIERKLIKEGYIPYDKSWIIRMGFLDLMKGYDSGIKFLKKHEGELSNDLKSLYQASLAWRGNRTINVGESGTLYRFLKFASWKLGLKKEFEFDPEGTLIERNKKISNNPKIIDYSLEKLLKLDKGTSQWASAAYLMGDHRKVKNPPYKLQLTYDAVEHWEERRGRGLDWEPRYDETILKQARTFLEILNNNSKPPYEPEQAEDYCFARAFEYITKEKGEKRWPSLRGHESDRIEEMEKGLKNPRKEILSKDHRVIQAIAMLQIYNHFENTEIKYPDCVNKSWPQFWKFLGEAEILKHEAKRYD